MFSKNTHHDIPYLFVCLRFFKVVALIVAANFRLAFRPGRVAAVCLSPSHLSFAGNSGLGETKDNKKYVTEKKDQDFALKRKSKKDELKAESMMEVERKGYEI